MKNLAVMLFATALTLLIFIIGLVIHVKHLTQPSLSCAVLHRPKDGCPKGYVPEAFPRFTDRDGSKEFACVSSDPKKEPCTDMLKSGERASNTDFRFLLRNLSREKLPYTIMWFGNKGERRK